MLIFLLRRYVGFLIMWRVSGNVPSVGSFVSVRSIPGWFGNWPAETNLLRILRMPPVRCCSIFIRRNGIRNCLTFSKFRHPWCRKWKVVAKCIARLPPRYLRPVSRFREWPVISKPPCSDNCVRISVWLKRLTEQDALWFWILEASLFYLKIICWRLLPGNWTGKWRMRWKEVFLSVVRSFNGCVTS